MTTDRPSITMLQKLKDQHYELRKKILRNKKHGSGVPQEWYRRLSIMETVIGNMEKNLHRKHPPSRDDGTIKYIRDLRNETVACSLSKDDRLRKEYLEELKAISKLDSELFALNKVWSEKGKQILFEVLDIIGEMENDKYRQTVSDLRTHRRDKNIVDTISNKLRKNKKEYVDPQVVEEVIRKVFL